MDTVSFPARLVASRFGRWLDPPAKVIVDPVLIQNDGDLARVIGFYRGLAECGGVAYNLTLTALGDLDRVVAEKWAELEAEAHPLQAPALVPQPSALDRAYLAARVAFAGQRGTLERLREALPIVRSGNVQDLGSGNFQVTSYGQSYTVDGGCSCPEFGLSAGAWCVHRLAVALVRKALAIEKERAGSADDTPAPAAPTVEDQAQRNDTIVLCDAQARAIVPQATAISLAGPWTRGAIEVETPETCFTVINRTLADSIIAYATLAGWYWQKSCRRWISPAAVA